MDNVSTPHVEAVSDRRQDPVPFVRWLTRDEFAAAQALVDVVVPGEAYSSVGVMDVMRGSSWVLIELAHPTKPDGTLVFVVPAKSGPQREPMNVGFAFTAPAASSREPRPLRDLARAARISLERLLVGLGWTWDGALSRAVDRCVVLEEEKGTDASR